MTSLSPEVFDALARAHEELEDSFLSWCNETGNVRLSEWLAKHKAELSDLYLAGLIDYHDPSFMPVSLEAFNEPYITIAGAHVICPYEHSSGSADPTLCYILNSNLLSELLAPHLALTRSQRRQKFIDIYTANHGYSPTNCDHVLNISHQNYSDI